MATDKLPYFKWYPADAEMDQDWIAMPYEARGVYMTLLNRSWINNGIPSDLKELARQLGIPFGKFQKIWERLGIKFSPGADGKLRNPRQEKEREKLIGKSESASSAAATKWEKVRSGEAMRTHMQSDMQTDIVCIKDAMPRAYGSVSDSGLDTQVPKTEIAPEAETADFDVIDAFQVFCRAYPKAGCTRKIMAEQLFRNVFMELTDRSPPKCWPLFREIMAGLDNWKASAQWKRGAINAMVNFIGERLWREEPLSAEEAARLAEQGRSRASRMPDLVS